MALLSARAGSSPVDVSASLWSQANGSILLSTEKDLRDDHHNENLFTSGQEKEQTIARLREAILRCQAQWRPAQGEPAISTGCPPLDALLPHRGWRWGTIVEWLAYGHGAGAKQLALGTLQPAVAKGAVLFVVDPHRQFYPPAAVEAGIPPHAIVIIFPSDQKDTIWTIVQILQVGKGVVVWADLPRCSPAVARRFQLAAEQSGALGFFFRDPASAGGLVWADLQLAVRPLPSLTPGERRQWRIELRRARGCLLPQNPNVELTWDEWTGAWGSASPVASATAAARRWARA